MKILFKNLSILIYLILLFPHVANAAAPDNLREQYANVMKHDTSQSERVGIAVALYNFLRVQPGTLLNLTKHLVANIQASHALTAVELMQLTAFPKRIGLYIQRREELVQCEI